MSGMPPGLPNFGPPQMLMGRHLMQSGIALTSDSDAALNATYATDDFARAGIQAEVNALAAGAFADGASSVSWPDAAGTAHNFTVEQFKAFASAVDRFVVQCVQYANGVTTSAPQASATIP